MDVCGNGTDPAWIEAAAAVFGGNVQNCPADPPRPGEPACEDARDLAVLLTAPSEKDVVNAVVDGIGVCYVLGTDFDISALRPPHRCFEGATKGLCISARSAYDLPVGSIVADALGAKFDLSAKARLNIDIALTEAVANALIHGCLDLKSPHERFDPAFVTDIETRIGNSAYGSLPIWIAICDDNGDALVITVVDEGRGFQPRTDLNFDDPLDASRGIGLIHSAADAVAFSDNGRCLEMKFSL